jgi:hypothetical protein
MSPTEDYPGPTQAHPEKQDNEIAMPPGEVKPTEPPMPTEQESALKKKKDRK